MYTYALEYHIAVLQGLQKVAAYTEDMFTSEEIDLHLNKQQNRFVEELVNKKFEDVQVMLDYIRPLITKNKKLQVFIPQSTDSVYESNMSYGVLPARYLYLINDRSGVVTSSNSGLCADISSYKTNSISIQTISEVVAALPMFTSIATQTPYYYNFTMTIIKAGVSVSQTIPAALNTIQSSKSAFYIVNYVLENFSFTGIDIYWEYYRDVYYPGSFVLVTNDTTITSVSITSQKSNSDSSSGGAASAGFNISTYTIPKYNATTIPGYVLNYTPNTLVEADDLYTENVNVFYQPKAIGPKTVISARHLMGYESKNFLISDLVIDYVRIPRQISLSLNQISELGGNACDIIVDRTVEYLKLSIENPAYQGVLNDNVTRDQA